MSGISTKDEKARRRSMEFPELSLEIVLEILFTTWGSNLLTSISVNGELSGVSKTYYTLVYREDHLSRGGYLCLKRDSGKYKRIDVL